MFITVCLSKIKPCVAAFANFANRKVIRVIRCDQIRDLHRGYMALCARPFHVLSSRCCQLFAKLSFASSAKDWIAQISWQDGLPGEVSWNTACQNSLRQKPVHCRHSCITVWLVGPSPVRLTKSLMCDPPYSALKFFNQHRQTTLSRPRRSNVSFLWSEGGRGGSCT